MFEAVHSRSCADFLLYKCCILRLQYMPPMRADRGAHVPLFFGTVPVLPTHCRSPRAAALDGFSAADATYTPRRRAQVGSNR